MSIGDVEAICVGMGCATLGLQWLVKLVICGKSVMAVREKSIQKENATMSIAIQKVRFTCLPIAIFLFTKYLIFLFPSAIL